MLQQFHIIANIIYTKQGCETWTGVGPLRTGTGQYSDPVWTIYSFFIKAQTQWTVGSTVRPREPVDSSQIWPVPFLLYFPKKKKKNRSNFIIP